MEKQVIRIGTRGSVLALIQTDMVKKELSKYYPNTTFETVVIKTKGDKQQNRSISSFGGKAVFVEEFEQALSDGTIDLAVHSAKDMPNPCREGLVIAGVLPRGPVEDMLLYRKDLSLAKETSFTVGTSSLRRQYQIKALYPHAICKDLRGNLATRIKKLKDGQYDAIILAKAGLVRQGLLPDPEMETYTFSVKEMLPAAAQAVIAVESRENDPAQEMAASISDAATMFSTTVERALLEQLHAGCHEPVGAYVTTENDTVSIELMRVEQEQIDRKCVQGAKKDWKLLLKQFEKDKD